MNSNIQTSIDFRIFSQFKRKRFRKSNRKSFITQKFKLQFVVNIIKKNINMYHLLRVLTKYYSKKRYRKYWLQFRKFVYQKMLNEKKNNFLIRFDEQNWNNILKIDENTKYQYQFRKKLIKLTKSKYFRWKFFDFNIQILNFIDKLKFFVDIVRNTTFFLIKFLNFVVILSHYSFLKFIFMNIKQIM